MATWWRRVVRRMKRTQTGTIDARDARLGRADQFAVWDTRLRGGNRL